MKGLLKFFGFIGFIMLMFYVRSAIVKSGIEAEANGFVNDTVGTVTRNWNRAELDRNADPSLAAQTQATGNPHALDFAHFARLGPRTSELTCELGDYNTRKDETRNYVAANYACSAMFEKGSAIIYLMIVRERDDQPWRIGYFDVVSPVLAPATVKG